ncbi:MAG TPA: hypothetical protein VFE88_02470 [Candidatus Nanoarchaeia archaeon]|nr:hypothetical protein [Candidatus Nanoarchaeia archaeon]
MVWCYGDQIFYAEVNQDRIGKANLVFIVNEREGMVKEKKEKWVNEFLGIIALFF